MKILALDIGRRRTGAAFADERDGVPLALDTFQHETEEELLTFVQEVVESRQIDHVIIGLPLLPSGMEGEQSTFVRDCGKNIKEMGISVSFLDERYTTTKTDSDGDANAAIQLLNIALKRGIDIC